MEINYSPTASAEASRKYRLLHPISAKRQRTRWAKANHAKQLEMQRAWAENNRPYVREYNRLSAAIYKAHDEGRVSDELELRAKRRLHCMSLVNRTTLGPMKKEI